MCNALQAHSRPRASGDQKIGMPIGPKNRLQPRSLTQAARPMLQPLRRRRSPLGRLLEHPVGDVLDVIGAEALAEGGHGALAVGDLVLDGLHVVATGEVLLERLLLELFLGDDAVVPTGMARRAIALEHRFAVLEVCRKGRPATHNRCKKAKSHTECQWAPRGRNGVCARGSVTGLRNAHRSPCLARGRHTRGKGRDKAAGAKQSK
mmetsp:Transcript_36145/g.82151  ORF Transcript_36145/g.82151 Transcript_36145/m.82151 type:complete len:206 (-) Transcript_36145:103-720(-)